MKTHETRPFLFDHRVTGIARVAEDDAYVVSTSRGEVRTKWVVNCAGAYASEVSEMLGYPNYPVRGFKGEYFVLDKKAGAYLKTRVYPAPNDKGGFSTHATPTVDGNILVGPDSYVTEGWEDYKCTKEHLDGLIRDGSKMFEQMRREFFIRNFAGIRWKRIDEEGNVLDFKLESDQQGHPNTVNLVGIESPGVTCALPLARRAVARRMTLEGAEVLDVFEVQPYASGLPRNVEHCLNDYNIPLSLSHTVTDIRGTDRLESVVISQVDDHMQPIPGTEVEYECDTLILSVGLIPENELTWMAGAEKDPGTSGPSVDESYQTTVPGIFVLALRF